ncbi:polyamine aminopropyltransferase [Streptomyces formicae]|uniref:Polyamine aminopropyltransferase n=1 Tax=Streptomyces formicae TaxID=1616117 RepID=A0ABY3WCQ9_9ACTN|nr:polyamine aminopropyltransferase [Streptomyces formicae]UNM10338.1 polyamine aminopropyltransferase [Streptomyces formicae]
MIDPPVSAPARGGARRLQGGARPPVRPGAGRFFVLLVVFVCAACGLVYELELVALASYLIGDSVTQASVVLSVMVFAMGLGSLFAKRLRCHAAVGFGLVEAALALIGGCSALVLYAAFAWFGEARYALVGFSLAIGVLIGAEIPLLMTLIQRASRRTDGEHDAAGTVADLFAADYVGALVGGLAFPFLLLPWLGQLTGAMLTGAVNAVAGGALVLCLFRRDLSRRARWWLLIGNVTVLALLATATALAADFESAARRAVYGEPVRVAVRTGQQEVVLTGARQGPLDLFLDGRLRVSGREEARYQPALVRPAMRGPHARVLVLGGGDGLAAREVLRHPGVRTVTLVERDPGMVRLARTDPALSALNGEVFRDARLRVVYADAFAWLRGAVRGGDGGGGYDVVIADLPEPGTAPGAKLYSQEFYGLTAGVLADGGRVAVHAGAIGADAHAYWTVESTMRAAGLATTPYHAPAHPARAFILATAGPPPGLGPGVVDLAPERMTGLPPSTLVHPRYGE